MENVPEIERMYKDKSLILYQSLTSKKGINHIIQVASEVLGNPVTLSDSSYRLLAYSNNFEVNDPIWNDLISLGYNSHEVVKKFNQQKIIEQINSNTMPIIVDTGIGENMRRILGKVVISGKIVAYIGVFEINHNISNDDIKLSAILCSILACELEKDSTISSLTGTLYENLIINLIHGSIPDERALQQKLKSSYWVPLTNYYVMYIPIEKNSPARLEIEYLRSYLERLSPYFKTVYINNSIILLINFDKKGEIESLWRDISFLLSEHKLKAGVSFEFSKLDPLKYYYKQAKNAFIIGQEVFSKKIIYYFHDSYPLYLLSELNEDICLMHYCHKGILKLFEFDKRNSTEYFTTLYAYMNSLFSLTHTAKKLFVHKNTMLHRLERIKEISGIDSIEQEDIFKIYLTYKILEYKKFYRDPKTR